MGITIVGLGPGNGRLLTREAWALLTRAETVYLRTRRHPAVADLADVVQLVSFDHVYDTAVSFEAVYETIVAELLALAAAQNVVYAVPGHPFVGESTVTAVVQAAQAASVPVTVIAGVSFVEPTLTAVGVDGLDGLQLFDAIEIAQFYHPPLNPDIPLLLGQVYNRRLAAELKLALRTIYPDNHLVYLIHAAGAPAESVESLPLTDIDQSKQIAHLTSLYVPPLPQKSSLAALAETVAVLRGPDGCPWDQEQTPQSMRDGFLEEASEVLEALDLEDSESLREELGDLLYHILMQVQMAVEVEAFRLSDVVAGIEAKLKYRHPHVWGDWEVADSAEVVRNWEMLKEQEKTAVPASLLDNISHALPALARSQKIQSRVGKVGFDWPDIDGVFAKLDEEVAELREAAAPEEQASELGDVLFVLVNLARWLELDAESVLREANNRFMTRFRRLEQIAESRSIALAAADFETLDVLWQEVKRLD